ncbi:MAG: hypothetical protein NT154_13220 [Verrucomicrobia bacterium]|nr:hypothetical protein [Verrucomicrobiota bacterium]
MFGRPITTHSVCTRVSAQFIPRLVGSTAPARGGTDIPVDSPPDASTKYTRLE